MTGVELHSFFVLRVVRVDFGTRLLRSFAYQYRSRHQWPRFDRHQESIVARSTADIAEFLERLEESMRRGTWQLHL